MADDSAPHYECATDGCRNVTTDWHCDTCLTQPGAVRHGYTLADINALARLAVHLDHWYRASDVEERLATAFSAIAEHLVASTQPPNRTELINAARAATDRATRDHVRTHGTRTYDIWAGREAMVSYQKYWWTFTRNTPSPETHIVERLTLAAVFPTLTPREREAVTLLASLGDYNAAATAMGITPDTYRVVISKARRRFFTAWHEGETPSKLWRTNRLVGSRRSTLDAHGKQRLTEAQVDSARGRIAAGETQNAVAADLGVSGTCLSRLIRGITKAVNA